MVSTNVYLMPMLYFVVSSVSLILLENQVVQIAYMDNQLQIKVTHKNCITCTPTEARTVVVLRVSVTSTVHALLVMKIQKYSIKMSPTELEHNR